MDLQQLGWDDFFQDRYQEYQKKGLLPARIIAQQKGQYQVYCVEGELPAQLAGKFSYHNPLQKQYPAVGDWVVVRLVKNYQRVIIQGVLERKNYFSRKLPISGGRKLNKGIIDGGITEEQVIAANIDTVFIISSLDNDFNLRRIERYLTLVYNSGTLPVIVLNKLDLCKIAEDYIQQVKEIAFGVPVYPISVTQKQGLELFASYLDFGKTVAFIGSSGVGKSTLTNYFLGVERQKTKVLSEATGKGRHTTTCRELIILPSGGMVIDTPGMKEIQLWGGEEEVKRNFEDVINLAKLCKFNDCRHDTEPGCAVNQALTDGRLSRERYESYLKQMAEIERLEEKKKLFDKRLSGKERLRLKIKLGRKGI